MPWCKDLKWCISFLVCKLWIFIELSNDAEIIYYLSEVMHKLDIGSLNKIKLLFFKKKILNFYDTF